MNALLYQSGLFAGALVLMSISSFVLTIMLERIGASWQISGGLLGILAALGADAPEISSSIAALSAGHHELGISVVLGSNIFNLAALLGLSAILTEVVRVKKTAAFFHGGVALLATIMAALLLTGSISASAGLVLILLLIGPYIYLVGLSPTRIRRLPFPHPVTTFMAGALTPLQEKRGKHIPAKASLVTWLSLPPLIFAIVAGSRGMVAATVWLAARFSISHVIAGTLVIAALTGIPNVVAALRLAERGRSAAVETECFNSNTLNLVLGICLPALLLGLGAPGARTFFALAWLGGMTIIAVALLSWRGGLRRGGGIALVVLYLLFAGAIIFSPHFVR
ncbi:MAG: hypothetical protein ACR2NX_10045 [Chthoniobacterales bacterium]